MRQARPWTKEEDSLLRTAVARQEGEATINWHEVASFIEGRNNKECRKRWVYALAPSINKGAWETGEDDLLREGVAAHGTKWAEVARVVGSRHPDQCSKRWHEVLKPNINRDRWSLMEDTTLRNAVLAHGRKWIEIVERYFPERTPIATRNRYFQLQKRDSESSDAQTVSNPESISGTPPPPSEINMSWAQQPAQYASSEFLDVQDYFDADFSNIHMQMQDCNMPDCNMPECRYDDCGMHMGMHPQMGMASPMTSSAPMSPIYYQQYMPASPMQSFDGMMHDPYAHMHHPGYQ